MNLVQQENRAIYPMSDVIQRFIDHTDQNLQQNMLTQRVWPNLIYPGFQHVNEARRVIGQWYATGEGQHDMHGRLVKADEKTGNVTVVYDVPMHMRFADLGVGKGVKAEDVERNRKARYKTRYTKTWNRSIGRSHRPFLMMEMRHLNTRIQNFMENTLGYRLEMEVYKYFDTDEWKYPL